MRKGLQVSTGVVVTVWGGLILMVYFGGFGLAFFFALFLIIIILIHLGECAWFIAKDISELLEIAKENKPTISGLLEVAKKNISTDD